jgi:hypothetical protein
MEDHIPEPARIPIGRSFAFAFLFVFTILLPPFHFAAPVPALFLVLSTIMAATSAMAALIFPRVCGDREWESNQHSR